MIAAGAPWFMTLFGRDSLLTSWMLLPLDMSLALGTLRTLASLQGERDNPLTEEEPGRILHETRSGRDASLALGGGSVYYGTADATPLFVMLLGELARWGLPAEAADELLPHADRALDWITSCGDRDGDGFVEYQRATEQGLVNQGWKDSFDGITFATGQIAEPPIALAEIQGYAYAAYLARAHLARERGDDGDRAALVGQGGRAQGASSTGPSGSPTGATSRSAWTATSAPSTRSARTWGTACGPGSWTATRRPRSPQHLVSRPMFSGFGIRTLATSASAYNPMSYHNGSVWPHDNAICAAGLMRYGFVPQAQQVATGILEAADRFGGRLPELFCGFDRADFAAPVAYPTSCSPQAWAAAAPFLLLRDAAAVRARGAVRPGVVRPGGARAAAAAAHRGGAHRRRRGVGGRLGAGLADRGPAPGPEADPARAQPADRGALVLSATPAAGLNQHPLTAKPLARAPFRRFPARFGWEDHLPGWAQECRRGRACRLGGS